MKKPDRRDFIKAAGGLAASSILASALGCSETKNIEELAPSVDNNFRSIATDWKGFKFAMCNECMGDDPWEDQCRVISQAGYNAIEIAPFTLVKEGVQEIDASGRRELKQVMDDYGLDCVGLHWLLTAPPKGLHFTGPDAALRSKSVDYMKALIDFTADLGGPYMIFGSPDQRSALDISVEDACKNLAEGLSLCADHCQERDVKILIESVTKIQTNVVNTMAEAVEIVETIDHPYIRSMIDYHNTADETDPMDKLIRDYIDYIEHVQISEMDGRHLGTGDGSRTYASTFQTFKDMGYDGWISLEIFDFEPGGEVIANESMTVLKHLADGVS